MSEKVNALVVGCGGIGTIATLNLEKGGRVSVTAVVRSNYDIISERGFNIKSVDHGTVNGFKPSAIRNTVPDLSTESVEPFKYLILATKNIPDFPPSLVDTIQPAVTPGHTIIVLMQNGLNIERRFLKAFPSNIILSGVSFCGSHQVGPGEIVHEYWDEIYVGAFRNPNLDPTIEDREAEEFCAAYKAAGKCVAEFSPDVGFSRWRKLLYNACLNPICAVTDLDTGRMQLAEGATELLLRPAMEEIRAAAKACGHDLPVDLVDSTIKMDPITMYNPPSMLVDVRNGRFVEFENIVGEPVREGTARGVAMPILSTMYALMKTLQWRTKERKGMVEIPAQVDHTAVPNGDH